MLLKIHFKPYEPKLSKVRSIRSFRIHGRDSTAVTVTSTLVLTISLTILGDKLGEIDAMFIARNVVAKQYDSRARRFK